MPVLGLLSWMLPISIDERSSHLDQVDPGQRRLAVEAVAARHRESRRGDARETSRDLEPTRCEG